jgi:hypothetical protein
MPFPPWPVSAATPVLTGRRRTLRYPEGSAMNDNTEVTTTEPANTTDRRSLRTTTRHLAHPVVHFAGLLTAHVVALAVLEKSPLLALLSLH